MRKKLLAKLAPAAVKKISDVPEACCKIDRNASRTSEYGIHNLFFPLRIKRCFYMVSSYLYILLPHLSPISDDCQHECSQHNQHGTACLRPVTCFCTLFLLAVLYIFYFLRFFFLLWLGL